MSSKNQMNDSEAREFVEVFIFFPIAMICVPIILWAIYKEVFVRQDGDYRTVLLLSIVCLGAIWVMKPGLKKIRNKLGK